MYTQNCSGCAHNDKITNGHSLAPSHSNIMPKLPQPWLTRDMIWSGDGDDNNSAIFYVHFERHEAVMILHAAAVIEKEAGI